MTDVISLPVVKEEILGNSTHKSIEVDLLKESCGRSSSDDENVRQDIISEVAIGKTCGRLSKQLECNRNKSDDRITCEKVQENHVEKNINSGNDLGLCNPVKKESGVLEKSYFPELEMKKTADNDIKTGLTCPYCQKNFENITSLDKHKEIHLGSWPFMCKICHKGFPFHHLLLSHVAFHKTETFPCYNCNKIYMSRYKLKAHMKTHINQFVCRICKQTFLTKDCLKSHKIIHKKAVVKKQIHICNICSAKFSISVELKSHLRMHASDWPFCCDVCKKLYRRRGSFLTHRSKCLGMNPYSCDICKKSFVRQCHFIQHVKQTHNGVRPFSCDTCNKRFNSKSNLEIHSQVHSTRLSTIYKCSLCQQMFNSPRKLRGHKIREHSLYRPYKCSTCKKIFIFKSQLSNHSKEHKIKEM